MADQQELFLFEGSFTLGLIVVVVIDEQISSNKLLQGVYFQQKPPDSPLYLTFKAVFSIMLGPPFTHLRTLGLIVVVVNPSVIR